MIYGLYLSAQGAEAQSTRLGVVANNLANASTNGFKRDVPIFQAFSPFDLLHGPPERVPPDALEQTGGMAIAEVVTDHSEGPLRQTMAPLDAAIMGPGFFQVSNGRETFLTRDGQFSINDDGVLVTASKGWAVLGTGGAPIAVPPEAVRVQIGNDGSVTGDFADGSRAQMGRIELVAPPSPADLRKIGNNLYAASRALPVGDDVELRQGFLEASGTNPITETLEMIQATRQFETNITMIQMQDDGLGRLLQTVPLRA